MKKLGGSQNFFMKNRGVKKNQEIIGWLQILMKILFNEIAQHAYFPRYAHWGYIFLQHCSSGWGGHKIFDHQIGGSQKYCQIHDSPIPKKMVAP